MQQLDPLARGGRDRLSHALRAFLIVGIPRRAADGDEILDALSDHEFRDLAAGVDVVGANEGQVGRIRIVGGEAGIAVRRDSWNVGAVGQANDGGRVRRRDGDEDERLDVSRQQRLDVVDLLVFFACRVDHDKIDVEDLGDVLGVVDDANPRRIVHVGDGGADYELLFLGGRRQDAECRRPGQRDRSHRDGLAKLLSDFAHKRLPTLSFVCGLRPKPSVTRGPNISIAARLSMRLSIISSTIM